MDHGDGLAWVWVRSPGAVGGIVGFVKSGAGNTFWGDKSAFLFYLSCFLSQQLLIDLTEEGLGSAVDKLEGKKLTVVNTGTGGMARIQMPVTGSK